MTNEQDANRELSRDELLVEVLAGKAANKVIDELGRREDRRAKRNAFIFSVLALIGAGGVVGVVGTQIDGAVERRIDSLDPTIERKASQAVDERVVALKRTLSENEMYSDFLYSTLDLQLATEGYSQVLEYRIIDLVEKLSQIERLVSREGFLDRMRVVVNRFAGANAVVAIDSLDDAVGRLLSTDKEIAIHLANHYGEAIVGSSYPMERLEPEYDRMRKYLRSARQNGWPEVGLFWEILIEFKRNGLESNETVDGLVRSIGDLGYNDKVSFFNSFEKYGDVENWLRKVTEQGKALEEAVKQLQNSYPEELAWSDEFGT